MRVLFLEPFYGGSHRAFLDTLVEGLASRFGVVPTVVTMPARHWKWRMRGAVPWLLEQHGDLLAPGRDGRPAFDVLFASSFLPLAEFVGLLPHFAAIPRVLYFHENQLAYPVREEFVGPRDRHFGWTQMWAAEAATRCVFNSAYNRDSFLETGAAWLREMPDARPTGWAARIAARSCVLGLPLDLPELPREAFADLPRDARGAGPLLLWNHRWEFDKDPETFFAALRSLRRAGVPFRLAVCGARARQVPAVMDAAAREFAAEIEHWGFVEDPAEYRALLTRTQVVVSTAIHEFFGVAVLEAVWAGARPLVPDRLAYRELLGAESRYQNLSEELIALCRGWTRGDADLRADRREEVRPFLAEAMLPRYRDLLASLGATGS